MFSKIHINIFYYNLGPQTFNPYQHVLTTQHILTGHREVCFLLPAWYV